LIRLKEAKDALCFSQSNKVWEIPTMSIWGKLAAATADLSLGGPIGAMIAGGAARDVRDRHKELDQPDNQLPFTVGVIVLGAKMAKADGRITTDEVQAFKEAFNVSAAEMKQAAPVFNLAKQDMAGYEACAEQLVTLFKGNRKLLEDVLEGLFHIAKADEEVHPQEEQFLGQVAKLFGFTDAEFGYIKARHVVAAKRNPYDVLGVKPSISDEELKRHYRMLVADNQPDKLMARGVPKEFVTIATEKVAAINAAYKTVARERRI
jgi:DnaJ like chaperone protein